MDSSLSMNSSMSVRVLPPSSCRGRVSIIQLRDFNVLPEHQPRRWSTLAFARRRNNPTAIASSEKKKRVKKEKKGLVEDDDFEADPLKLFSISWKILRMIIQTWMKMIKTLASELCLNPAVVLELLSEPPLELLMMSATLLDEPVKREPEPVPEIKHIKTEVSETTMVSAKHEPKVKKPVHVMQQ
ncbi:hypothetical protein F3Y22_tig00112010pilonHSYRG00016 [Hibiscus syriacus]|uniref:Uncharacterized protein n=1 Tax=Hibiscus syriacus TaxID=106335 RepID=A0A6A2YE89_HIBSY|nr:hypothetical protein F3Y22_tig00112010pilonHSYRG00016 [Hibiscus syriacus]